VENRSMEWKTSISVNEKGEHFIRGVSLRKLIRDHSFVQAFFLLSHGRFPKKVEERMLNAIFVSAIEHGVEVPSTFVARSVVSTGNSTNTALAAGILAVGDFHGGAIEKAAYIFKEKKDVKKVVAMAIKNKDKIPGLGHKIFKRNDPRTEELFKLARKLKLFGKYSRYAVALQKEFKKQSGKQLVLNVDGSIAALMLELGFDPKFGKLLFSFARTPGIITHIIEEISNENPYRRFSEKDVIYKGVKPKKGGL